jgi:putative polyhydroxyalkanoate system protein
MSDIRIRRAHSRPLDEARRATEKMAKQLRKDFDLDYAWQGDVLHFERSGVDGAFHVTAKEVRLEAKLGFLLAFLKPRIEAEVEAQLDKHLGHAAKPPAKAAVAKKKPARR